MFPRKASQVFRICTSIYSQQGVSGARLADMLPPRCRKSKMLGTQKLLRLVLLICREATF